MSDEKVIPFRKRPPSETELEVYRRITRQWSSLMRQMMFPDYFRYEKENEANSS